MTTSSLTNFKGGTSRAPASTSQRRINYWALTLLFLAAYLQNTINAPGLGAVAGPLAFLASAALLIKTRHQMTAAELGIFLWIFILAIVFGMLSLSGTNFALRVALSSVQLMYFFFIGYTALVLIRGTSPNQLHRFGLIALITLLVGALLELFTPIRQISDSFRNAFYGSFRAYSGDARDILEHGGLVRPKFFASEPSYLALYGGLSFLAAFLTARSPRRRSLTLFLLALFAVAVRSPSLIGPMAATASFYCLAAFSIRWRERFSISSGELWASMTVVVLALAYITFSAFGDDTGQGRLAQMASGRDNSFLIRVGVPSRIMLDVVNLSPLFGTGIGGNEPINDIILRIFANNVSDFYYLYDSLSMNIGSTPISHWTYFGILGGIVILLLYNLLVYINISPHSTRLFWILYIPYGVSVGGYSFHSWILFFTILGILASVMSVHRTRPAQRHASATLQQTNRTQKAWQT